MSKDDIDIIWLASFPKSGNTWLRFFLTCLIQGKPENSSAVTRCIPEIGSNYERDIEACTGQTIVKTHLLYSEKLPLLERTRGFIYVLRHPLDVMLSAYNYHLLQLGNAYDCSDEEYLRRYVRHYVKSHGEPHWLELGYGTWEQHMLSWTEKAALEHPHLVIRYEDMLNHPLGMAHTLNSFLQLKRSPAQIEEALEFASFKNMRAMEEREIQRDEDTFFRREKHGIGHTRGVRFMNKGTANNKHRIPLGVRRQSEQYYRPYMEKFGYT